MTQLNKNNKVELRLIYLVLSQLKFGMAAELIMWSVLFGLLWASGNHILLTTWFTLSVTLCLARFMAVHNVKHRKISDELIDPLVKFIAVCAFIAGASWAPLGWWLMPSDTSLQILIFFILIGTIAVANLFYSPLKNTYILFLIPAYVPHIMWLFSRGGMHILIGLAAIAYFVLMMILSRHINLLLSDSIKSQFTTQNLIDDLTGVNQMLFQEIKEHEKSQEKVSKLNYQLLAVSRCAGMLDATTNLLHNVGNVLTSVKASVTILQEQNKNNKADKLYKIAQIFAEHKNASMENSIPEYLNAVAKNIEAQNKENLAELESVMRHIDAIEAIIDVDKYDRFSMDFTEEVALQTLFEDALMFYQSNYGKQAVTIKIEDSVTKPVLIDKVKALHIIINLISNAVDSLNQSKNADKVLTLTATPLDKKHFQIKVADNGIGIAAENFSKLFLQGYSTKRDGHGFGLHTCILYTKELHGEIHCSSEGLDKGASFIITLPYEPSKANSTSDTTSDVTDGIWEEI